MATQNSRWPRRLVAYRISETVLSNWRSVSFYAAGYLCSPNLLLYSEIFSSQSKYDRRQACGEGFRPRRVTSIPTESLAQDESRRIFTTYKESLVFPHALHISIICFPIYFTLALFSCFQSVILSQSSRRTFEIALLALGLVDFQYF